MLFGAEAFLFLCLSICLPHVFLQELTHWGLRVYENIQLHSTDIDDHGKIKIIY